MRKPEYISDMEQMLNNPKDFDRLNENTLKKLKNSSFRILDNWRKKGLLGKDIRWKDIDTTNSVLPIDVMV